MHTTTIISIDTGNPELSQSTTAVVRMVFQGETIKRRAIVFSGSFLSNKNSILKICEGADHVVVEKIESTNKYLARAVIEEQIGMSKFLIHL